MPNLNWNDLIDLLVLILGMWNSKQANQLNGHSDRIAKLEKGLEEIKNVGAQPGSSGGK